MLRKLRLVGVARGTRTLVSPRSFAALVLVLGSTLGAASASAEDEHGHAKRDNPAHLNALVGAETADQGIQALAFLPNDIMANVGDQVTWSFPTHEPHTITLVPAGQARPPASAPAAPNNSTFDGTQLVNSGTLLGDASYTVKFGASGDFAYVCLIHSKMSGTIHVQPAGSGRDEEDGPLIEQGRNAGQELLQEGRRLERDDLADVTSDSDAVTIGSGLVLTTAEGTSSVMIARFLPETRRVHVGDTVDWTALDPATPHTVTFGPTPGSPAAVIGFANGTASEPTNPANQTISSGFLGAPFARQHASVTFNAPGTYVYYCALHADLGMRGTIVVSQ